jgi:hypothetical protein
MTFGQYRVPIILSKAGSAAMKSQGRCYLCQHHFDLATTGFSRTPPGPNPKRRGGRSLGSPVD